MTSVMKLNRTYYAVFLALYAALMAGTAFYLDDLGLERYARAIRTGLTGAYVICSSARLADAGFRFLRSFAGIILVLFVLPATAFVAYVVYIGLPKVPEEHEPIIVLVAVGAGLTLQILVTLFCFLFPSAAQPAAEAAGPLLGHPTSGGRAVERQEPRF